MPVLSGEDRSLRAKLLRLVAAAAEPLYTAVVNVRNLAYDRGWRRARRAHCPVVSIGNLTVGGTGKTPMVIEIVERLQRHGRRPAVVLRGYKGESTGGSDEAAVIAHALDDVPVIVDADRVAAARLIERKHPAVDVIVLDDAFQHRRIARDLDLVLIDAAEPFGFGHVLPRGLLREPPTALARADAVLVTRCDRISAEQMQQLDTQIAAYRGRSPEAHTAHRWGVLHDQRGRVTRPEDIRGKRVIAFAGIAQPRAFFDQAARYFDVIEALPLPDHFAYDMTSVLLMARLVDELKPDGLLTTEKDWVKLRRLLRSWPVRRPIYRPELTITWVDGEDEIDAMLKAMASDQRYRDEG